MDFNSSCKNIGLPSRDKHRNNLTNWMKRIRWKGFFFEKCSESGIQDKGNLILNLYRYQININHQKYTSTQQIKTLEELDF